MPIKFALALASVLLIAPAGAAAAVSVRAEAGDPAAVVSTSVTPTAGPVTGNGGAFSCSGTNTAAGALNAATAGNWAGQEFFGDFQVGRIAGADLTTASTAPYYWSFNVNEAPAAAGICQTTIADNDRLLFYKACNTATSGCYSDTILSVSGPPAGAVAATSTFTVQQVSTTFGPAPSFAPTTTRTPAAGVTVVAGGVSAVTGADGTATLTLPPGEHVVRATRGSDVPGETRTCSTSSNNGLCGTPDRSYPTAAIDIQQRKRYQRRGPRTLSGTALDTAGVKRLQLRLTRRPSTRSNRCETFDSTRGRFAAQSRCGITRGKLFDVAVSGGRWSYLLPSDPTRKGRYVLDAIVTDAADNANIERVVFFVR